MPKLKAYIKDYSCSSYYTICDRIWENQHLTPQIFMAKIMHCTVQVNLIVSTE